jgi:hypothetical protein
MIDGSQIAFDTIDFRPHPSTLVLVSLWLSNLQTDLYIDQQSLFALIVGIVP